MLRGTAFGYAFGNRFLIPWCDGFAVPS